MEIERPKDAHNQRNNKNYDTSNTVKENEKDKENSNPIPPSLMRQPDPDEESTCNILPLKSEIEYQKRHQKQEEADPKEKGITLPHYKW